MVFNTDKCSFMSLCVDDELQTNLVCGNETLKNSKQEKVPGVNIDNKLNFATHLSNITKNANIALNALTRVEKYMTTDQKNVYFVLLLDLSSLIALWYRCFAQNILFVELTSYMNDACALFNKTTPLISKNFLRIQMKNQSTKNA